MKVKEIKMKNFCAYENVTVSFSQNVTYLAGKNGSGKSTVGISAIHAALQGVAEKSSGGNQPLIGERFRFIGNKGRSANIELTLFDEVKGFEVKVIRKITASGQTLSFEAPDGMELDQEWLNSLFNIFMIAPKKFTELSSKDQAVALGIDTKQIDADISALKQELTGLNRDMKQFENLVPVEEFEEIDIQDLQDKKAALRVELNDQYLSNKEQNTLTRNLYLHKCKLIDEECTKWNNVQIALETKIRVVTELLTALLNEGYEGTEVAAWILSLGQPQKQKDSENLYPPEPTDLSLMPYDYVPEEGEQVLVKEIPNDSELLALDEKISAAVETNNKSRLYKEYLIRVAAKEEKEREIKDNKQRQTEKLDERMNKIKSYKFPFDNLSVNDEGELMLNDRPIKTPYFSTGQLLKIVPKLIATTKPELKYIFLQDFNLMDEEIQADVEKDLTDQGFQLVIEYVGKNKVVDKNCILLKDGNIVDSYDAPVKENIL